MPLIRPSVTYEIDAQDRIVQVNAAWDDFALANHGDAIVATRVLGRTLWEFVSDPTIQDLYERMVKLTRQGRRFRFRYRCDSPRHRRVFAMKVTRAVNEAVTFTSTLESEVPRAPALLLESRRPAGQTLVRVCSWCHAVAWPDETWKPLEDTFERVQLLEPAELPQLTHGICGPCAESVFLLVKKS